MHYHHLLLLALSTLALSQADHRCAPLSLPWAKYEAIYEPAGKICRYDNVRFARAPTGPLRFQAPQDPLPRSTSPSGQISCIQVDTSGPCVPGKALPRKPSCNDRHGAQDEDCLFLDLYVPESASTATRPLPVVVWIYGGAFAFGSKSQFDTTRVPLYDGTGPINASSDQIIFVAPNYRLGAFGWLAGSYLESQFNTQTNTGLTNAGLRDQRKALEFVRDHISKVNGDRDNVSVWGESAGASSILHHLIADFGDQSSGTLFNKAILQSPAFEWSWDRDDTLNNTYTAVAKAAGCPSGELSCMQNVTTEALANANQFYFREITTCLGLFPLGPALDGSLIKDLPPVALSEGKFYKNLTSIIVSHVANEVKRTGTGNFFIPGPIKEEPCSELRFQEFLANFFPENDTFHLRQQVSDQYPIKNYKFKAPPAKCFTEGDQRLRAGDIIRDAVFTCNTRHLFNAYSKLIPTYMMEYHLFALENAAIHGSDLFPTFYNNKLNMKEVFEQCMSVPGLIAGQLAKYFIKFAPAYQSYFTSHAISGDPNSHTIGWARSDKRSDHTWRKAVDVGGKIGNTMLALGLGPNPRGPGYSKHFDPGYTDDINTEEACKFWEGLAYEVQGRSDRAGGPVLVRPSSNAPESQTS